MKSALKLVYVALVGLIVFTGALFIAQGALSGEDGAQPSMRGAQPTVREAQPEATVPPDAQDGPFLPNGEDAPIPHRLPAPDGAVITL